MMKQSGRLLFATTVTLCLGLTGCREAAPERDAASPSSRLSVYVVNYPLQYFAERIGGEFVDVSFPAPPDVDPAEWRPDDDTIMRYQQADLIFLNGADYARWTRRASLPAGAVVNTAAAFRDQLLEVPDAVVHRHGDGPAHSHAGLAFTTWLDPRLAIEHARAIQESLGDRIPVGRAHFEGAFAALAHDLETLDRTLSGITSRQPDRPLLASHPVYQYLEARYGLNIHSLHWEPDEAPPEEEWSALQTILEDHPAQWILWEDQPLAEVVERLASIGITSIVYDLCAQPPEEGNFLSVMEENAANLRAAFASEN